MFLVIIFYRSNICRFLVVSKLRMCFGVLVFGVWWAFILQFCSIVCMQKGYKTLLSMCFIHLSWRTLSFSSSHTIYPSAEDILLFRHSVFLLYFFSPSHLLHFIAMKRGTKTFSCSFLSFCHLLFTKFPIFYFIFSVAEFKASQFIVANCARNTSNANENGKFLKPIVWQNISKQHNKVLTMNEK